VYVCIFEYHELHEQRTRAGNQGVVFCHTPYYQFAVVANGLLSVCARLVAAAARHLVFTSCIRALCCNESVDGRTSPAAAVVTHPAPASASAVDSVMLWN